MGILNNKSRIMDTILTQEGRKQLAQGQLKAKFYSFSDYAAIYKSDTIVSGGLTDTHRFILEATGLPQDNIIFEVDDSGKLSAFPMSGSAGYTVLQGQVFSGSSDGSQTMIKDDVFNEFSKTLLSQSLNAFKNQMILKSPDPLDERKREFVVGPTVVSFSITETMPISKDKIKEASINHIESLFFDKRLSHLKNFQFLPPKNKPLIGETDGSSLGNFVNLNQQQITRWDDLNTELSAYEKKTIFFTETSTDNNLFCQFFELGSNVMSKLDVVDFGLFKNPNGGEPYHVFFIGKVFTDDLGTNTFVNLFTLVFE